MLVCWCVGVCAHWALSLARHQSSTDFESDICGGLLFAPPFTSACVQSRFEFVELGRGMCSNYHMRHWDYRLVPAGATHYTRAHYICTNIWYICTGTKRFTCCIPIMRGTYEYMDAYPLWRTTYWYLWSNCDGLVVYTIATKDIQMVAIQVRLCLDRVKKSKETK